MSAPAHDPSCDLDAPTESTRHTDRASDAGAKLRGGKTTGNSLTAIEVTVADHPGVLAQVCSLLARRSFQAEAVCSLPARDGQRTIWLLMPSDARLEQLTRQLTKLGDVLAVEFREEGRKLLETLNEIM
jgi:acetolactate synthase-1/3 small subunit